MWEHVDWVTVAGLAAVGVSLLAAGNAMAEARRCVGHLDTIRDLFYETRRELAELRSGLGAVREAAELVREFVSGDDEPDTLPITLTGARNDGHDPECN